MTQLSMGGIAISTVTGHRVWRGVLDTARVSHLSSPRSLDASVHDVQAYVLGGHGDTMVPLTRLTTVRRHSGLADLIHAERLETIVQRARDGGAEIVKPAQDGQRLLCAERRGRADDRRDRARHPPGLPCTVHLEGEYGINGLFTGGALQARRRAASSK